MKLPSTIRTGPSILVGVLAVVIIILGVAAAIFIYTKIDATGREHAIDRVNTLAQALPVSEVEALTGSDADLTSPAYQNLKALMVRERTVNRGVRFVYLVGQLPTGELFFYGDSEDPVQAHLYLRS